MYMDDLDTSCNSLGEVWILVDQPHLLLASGGFHLHKWASNEPVALRAIPVEKTAKGTGGRPWKTLGINWERDDDHSLWQRGVAWDESLPEEVERHWVIWKRELVDLPFVRFPRALVPVPLEQAKRTELHAFCDASERAYGAVVYLRVETASGSERVSLVAAKTRITPVKRLSLLRLELKGALTALRLIRFAQEALQLDICSISCWGDSKITLAWVRSATSRWKPLCGRDPAFGGTCVLEALPWEK
ncbi:Pao retrotransposon peptidase family protein [Trichinella spiralis]|uniref:Pao retrotransposon peptidase family protein n=1 Tax=Trichinella spiralis TaxID=6334 RepID=UPI0001EFECF3|nr:Pao retrotransposon peptidase family protein [Trichinella spiralis]